ncbi:mitochondrial import receptor subunit TOM20 homolog [Phlebotomus argentipes]|uniref:mitochondrial import receptor subunit TOM20 homolog n=1 Tax=Phlebotomus argentipes TaxID=94469 RepID=UPI0028929CF5|nr:mitochondrial import receptor subunit TOM20 homolog [Phlebotomus argentipes]
MEINKTTLGIAAGVAGTLFLGYCIYFDHKRRTDPEYKRKVRERRRKAKKAAAANRPDMPNLMDKEAVQKFFLQEIQLGEMLISNGQIEQGVEHLANAVVVCGQPTQLLQVLQQTMPAQVFTLLIHKMKEYSSKMGQPREGGGVEELSDDLE